MPFVPDTFSVPPPTKKSPEVGANAPGAVGELPRLDGEGLGFWQKQLRNKKISEEELRKLVHPDSVDEILRRLGRKASGVHDSAKIIESIEKTSSAAAKAAKDFAEGRISRDEFEKIVDKLESISEAQKEFFKRRFDE